MKAKALFDHKDWDGDKDKLHGSELEFFEDDDLAERTFCSKHEAFCAGFTLGESSTESGETSAVEVEPSLTAAESTDICSTSNAQEDTVITVHCCRCGKTGKLDEFHVPVAAWVKIGVADVDLVEDTNYFVTESDIDHALCRGCWDEIEEPTR